MKLGLFGKTGQVATELRGLCVEGETLIALGRDAADFSDPETVRAAAEAVDCDVLVNAVAYTAVDRAESEPDLARTVNATSVGVLAKVAAARGLPLIHISTDYVFPGTGSRPYRPDDATEPLGVYGRTKLEGENAIRASGVRHVTLRTSWVFSAHGSNFVKTMLRLSETRDALDIVSDQIGGPTAASDIAYALLMMSTALDEGHAGGTFHYAGSPDVSWADFAREIFRQTGRATTVSDIRSEAYPTPARRPLNSRLDCTDTLSAFDLPRPEWQISLASVIQQISSERTPASQTQKAVR